MKHDLALCCIIKDETNLEEFIIYYVILGVTQIYIYDNESSFPIKKRLLHNFFYKKYCTVIDFPGKCQQMNAYNHCIKNYGNNIDWLAVVDADEFIVLKTQNTLPELLKQYEDKDAVAINWVIFGTSHHNNIQNGLVIDNYRYCESNPSAIAGSLQKQDKHIKVICKPTQVLEFNNPHYAIMKDMNKFTDLKGVVMDKSCFAFNYNYTIDIAQINHYTFKSLEECNNKHFRGNADKLDRRGIFNETIHNHYNDMIDNYLPDKYMNKINQYIRMIAVNIHIYKALNRDLRNLTNADCCDHLLYYSIKECRPLHIKDKYPNFSRDNYRGQNPQFNNLTDVEIEIKYIYSHE